MLPVSVHCYLGCLMARTVVLASFDLVDMVDLQLTTADLRAVPVHSLLEPGFVLE